MRREFAELYPRASFRGKDSRRESEAGYGDPRIYERKQPKRFALGSSVIPDQLKLPPRMRLELNQEMELMRQPMEADLHPKANTPFHSTWVECLDKEFPDGTDFLRTEENQRKVRSWRGRE